VVMFVRLSKFFRVPGERCNSPRGLTIPGSWVISPLRLRSVNTP
jgi:hypothetical protein